jgi:hypothetical protein
MIGQRLFEGSRPSSFFGLFEAFILFFFFSFLSLVTAKGLSGDGLTSEKSDPESEK